MTVRQILLTKLNSILNPNFENKYIASLLIIGFSLIGYQNLLTSIAALEFINENIYLKFSLENSNDILFKVIGIIFILISIYLFYNKRQFAKEGKLLKEIHNTITSPNILTFQNDSEIANIKNFLIKYNSIFHKKHITNLSRLFQELAFNSKSHGYADNISLEKKGNILIFKDDGNLYNPLEHLPKYNLPFQTGGMHILNYFVDDIDDVELNYSQESGFNQLTLKFNDIEALNEVTDCTLNIRGDIYSYNFDNNITSILDNDCHTAIINLTEAHTCISSLRITLPRELKVLYDKHIDITIQLNKEDDYMISAFNSIMQNIIKSYDINVVYI